MNHVHPTMQQALQFFTGAAMSVQRVRFTVNPAFPHPDQNSDDAPVPTMAEAIEFARKVLKDPNADAFIRQRAAFDLLLAFENHEEQS